MTLMTTPTAAAETGSRIGRGKDVAGLRVARTGDRDARAPIGTRRRQGLMLPTVDRARRRQRDRGRRC